MLNLFNPMKIPFLIPGVSLILLGIILPASCKKNKTLTPSLTATEVELVSATSALSGGNITGGDEIINVRGVCWNTSPAPTILDSKQVMVPGQELSRVQLPV